MTIPLSFLTQLPSPFFMQHPRSSHTRKRWYQRAIEASMLWKALSKPIDTWKTNHTTTTTSSSRKLRKCTSTSRVASSFTHVCLCAPISSSSYTDTVRANVVSPTPRRSFSYPRSRSAARQEVGAPSVEGRKIFRGKSLTDDVFLRRLVIDEAMVQVRRRNEMEIIRRRSGMRKRKHGPSPLSRMVLAEEEE